MEDNVKTDLTEIRRGLNFVQDRRQIFSVIFFYPITGLDRPLGFQEAEAPRFLDNRHMKVVRLSALRTGLL
jgi:hypothetical protein